MVDATYSSDMLLLEVFHFDHFFVFVFKCFDHSSMSKKILPHIHIIIFNKSEPDKIN